LPRLSWLTRPWALYGPAFGEPHQDDLLALLDHMRDDKIPAEGLEAAE
jgi:hypothetical protein